MKPTYEELEAQLAATEKTSSARRDGLERAHKMFQRERDRADDAEKRNEELEAQVKQLAAENAARKNGNGSAIEFRDFYSWWSIFNEDGLRTEEERMLAAGAWMARSGLGNTDAYQYTAPETPATDARVESLRNEAQWIEGSEPAEFGRYWVRYETDIGPQYCSAQWIEYNFCAPSNTNIHKIWLDDRSRSIHGMRGVTHYAKLPAALELGEGKAGEVQ